MKNIQLNKNDRRKNFTYPNMIVNKLYGDRVEAKTFGCFDEHSDEYKNPEDDLYKMEFSKSKRKSGKGKKKE